MSYKANNEFFLLVGGYFKNNNEGMHLFSFTAFVI